MLFSIIIPTYNYANFLKHALQSAFEQHYKDFEVIVVDDGSTDNTLEVCQAFKNHYGKQINVIQQANAGPGAARNRGIDAAKGEFLLFLDADDELDRDALSYYRKAISDNRQAECIIAGHRSHDVARKQEKVIHGSNVSENKIENFHHFLNKKIHCCNGAMVIAKRKLGSIRFAERLRLCEDMQVFAQLIATCKVQTIKQPLLHIRKHDDSRRHNPDGMIDCVDQLPGAVFNADIIPVEAFKFKNEFTARMYCRTFRALYSDRRFKEARRYYFQAIRLYPKIVFEWGYFRKVLKSFFKFKASGAVVESEG